jgi:hypothetical protein
MWQAIDIMMRAPTPLDFQIVGDHDADGATTTRTSDRAAAPEPD